MRVIPKYTDPKLQDEVVQTLNTKLEACTYIEYFYPIAHLGTNKEDETYPQIYRNDGSEKNLMLFPDNKAKSFIFWEFVGATILDDDEGVDYNLSLIFWGNLDRMDNKHYDYTGEIQQEILQILKTNGARDISFEDYDFATYSMYQENERQTLMRPNTAFKIDLIVHENNICG